MNKHKLFLVLITVSMVALIGTASCAPAAPTAIAKPTINSFTATPASLTAGQSTTLSWDVSGATTVTIEPAIGNSGSSGSLTLTPSAATTYTLTAANDAGSTTSSVSVSVTPVVTGKSDLKVNNVWLTGGAVYYEIENVGNAASNPSQTALYTAAIDKNRQRITWLKQTTDWLEPLAAGEKKVTYFPNFDWLLQIVFDVENVEFVGYDVKVCADDEDANAENNEGNNCRIESWGPEFTYDFFANAHLATWKSSNSAEPLRWPMVVVDKKGAAVRATFAPILTICPEQVSNGWILGRFGDLEETQAGVAMVPFTVPLNVKFTSKVGFPAGAKSTDGVTVALGYLDDMGSIVFFPKMTVNSDGQMHDYNVDLSSLAGKKTEFFLLVEANGSPEGDCVRWVEPMISPTEQPGI